MPGGSARLRVVPKTDEHYGRVSALEIARRSAKGAPLFPFVALITTLSTRIFEDFPVVAASLVLGLLGLAGARVGYARKIESAYDRFGKGAVRIFVALMALQSLLFSVAGSIVIVHYGVGPEAVFVIVFAAGASAAATSSLSPRRRVHQLFLACIQVPLFIAVLISGGIDTPLFLAGFLVFTAFLTSEGVDAERSYRTLVERTLEVEEALSEIRTLRGIIPICAGCKKIRDDFGYWEQVESYVTRHTHALFSHGLCPGCEEEYGGESALVQTHSQA